MKTESVPCAVPGYGTSFDLCRLMLVVLILNALAPLAFSQVPSRSPVLAVEANPLVEKMLEVKDGRLFFSGDTPIEVFKNCEATLVTAKMVSQLDPPPDLVLELVPGKAVLGNSRVTSAWNVMDRSTGSSTTSVMRTASAEASVSFKLYSQEDRRRPILAGVASGSGGGTVNANMSRDFELVGAYHKAVDNALNRIPDLAAARLRLASKLTAEAIGERWTLRIELKNQLPCMVSGAITAELRGLTGVAIDVPDQSNFFHVAPGESHEIVLGVIMPEGIRASEKQIATTLERMCKVDFYNVRFGAEE